MTTKRTRLFIGIAAGILVVGLGTGLLASYVGLQNIVVMGSDGPDELAYVAQDARMVAYANVRDVMNSELRQKVLQFHPNAGSDDDKFRQETGINLEQDVDHVVAATVGSAAAQRPLLLARGRFDAGRIETAVQNHGGEAEDYAGTRILKHSDNDFALAFLEPDLVAVGTLDAVRRAIDTKAGGADVRKNGDVMRMVRDIYDSNAWAVARFDALTGNRLPAELANQLPAISWFSASGHINGGVRGQLRAEARDDAAANDLREVIRGFMALARMQAGQRAEIMELMNSVQLAGDGKTVALSFEVGPEMLEAIGAMRADRGQVAEPAPKDPGL